MFSSNYPGTCPACKTAFAVGTAIEHSPGGGYQHAGHCPKRTPDSAPQVQTTQTGLDPIRLMLEAAKASGLQWPKIKLVTTSGKKIALGISGPTAKNPGAVWVNDGVKYPNSKMYGFIRTTGVDTIHDDEVRDMLMALAYAPASTVAEHGLKTGNCSFCSKELTTNESLAVGYGPVCAGHYGLPWGKGS